MEDERVHIHAEPFGDGIIGKLILPSFYESGEGSSCEIDMREALRELKKKGNLLGLVLDMRENSGGFLNQAVKVAGLFITSGVDRHLQIRTRRDAISARFRRRSYYNGPLIDPHFQSLGLSCRDRRPSSARLWHGACRRR